MTPAKEDFDWLCCEMTGFMRTQVLAVAASLRLAEHLQERSRTAEDFAAVTGIEQSMAFRFLRACTKIGLTACDDGRTFKSTSRLQALHGETPGSLGNKRWERRHRRHGRHLRERKEEERGGPPLRDEGGDRKDD